MAIKVQVELDCEHLREQLRELISEIVDDVVKNGPVIIDNRYLGSPNSEQIAQDIARLINGNPVHQKNIR